MSWSRWIFAQFAVASLAFAGCAGGSDDTMESEGGSGGTLSVGSGGSSSPVMHDTSGTPVATGSGGHTGTTSGTGGRSSPAVTMNGAGGALRPVPAVRPRIRVLGGAGSAGAPSSGTGGTSGSAGMGDDIRSRSTQTPAFSIRTRTLRLRPPDSARTPSASTSSTARCGTPISSACATSPTASTSSVASPQPSVRSTRRSIRKLDCSVASAAKSPKNARTSSNMRSKRA